MAEKSSKIVRNVGKVAGKVLAVAGPVLDLAIGIYEITQINFYETSTAYVVGKSIALALAAGSLVCLALFPPASIVLGAASAIAGLISDVFLNSDPWNVIRGNLNVYQCDSTKQCKEKMGEIPYLKYKKNIAMYTREYESGNSYSADNKIMKNMLEIINGEPACSESTATPKCHKKVCKKILGNTVSHNFAVESASSRARALLTGFVAKSEERMGYFILSCYASVDPKDYPAGAPDSILGEKCPSSCPGCSLFRKVMGQVTVSTALWELTETEDEKMRDLLGSCGMLNTADDDETVALINGACSCENFKAGCPSRADVLAFPKDALKSCKNATNSDGEPIQPSICLEEVRFNTWNVPCGDYSCKITGTSTEDSSGKSIKVPKCVIPRANSCGFDAPETELAMKRLKGTDGSCRNFKATTGFKGKSRTGKTHYGGTIEGLGMDMSVWPVEVKGQMLENMFNGFTGDPEEKAILKMWKCTTDADRATLIGNGWTYSKFYGEFSNWNWQKKDGMSGCFPVDLDSAAGDDDFARKWVQRAKPAIIAAEARANGAERLANLIKAMITGPTLYDDERAIGRIFNALAGKGSQLGPVENAKLCEVMRDLLLWKIFPDSYYGDVNYYTWNDIGSKKVIKEVKHAKEICGIAPILVYPPQQAFNAIWGDPSNVHQFSSIRNSKRKTNGLRFTDYLGEGKKYFSNGMCYTDCKCDDKCDKKTFTSRESDVAQKEIGDKCWSPAEYKLSPGKDTSVRGGKNWKPIPWQDVVLISSSLGVYSHLSISSIFRQKAIYELFRGLDKKTRFTIQQKTDGRGLSTYDVENMFYDWKNSDFKKNNCFVPEIKCWKSSNKGLGLVTTAGTRGKARLIYTRKANGAHKLYAAGTTGGGVNSDCVSDPDNPCQKGEYVMLQTVGWNYCQCFRKVDLEKDICKKKKSGQIDAAELN